MIVPSYAPITLVPPYGLDKPRDLFYHASMNGNEMLAELGGSGTPAPRYPYQEGKAVKKLRYSHDAMVDQIVANPWVSQGELAAMFGYTQAWVCLVMSSDAWKERLAARRAELVDPTLVATLNERWAAVEKRSLEVLAEKLSQPAAAVPENLALRAAELGAKVRGVGGNAPSTGPASPRLEELAARLTAFLPAPRPVYEGELVIPNPS
jgi:hypothetical protein